MLIRSKQDAQSTAIYICLVTRRYIWQAYKELYIRKVIAPGKFRLSINSMSFREWWISPFIFIFIFYNKKMSYAPVNSMSLVNDHIASSVYQITFYSFTSLCPALYVLPHNLNTLLILSKNHARIVYVAIMQ